MKPFATSRRWALAAAMVLGLLASLPIQAAETPATVATATGAHQFSLEIADTPEKREVGLMNRRSMPAGHGMLFEFGESRPVTMWMKNTFIPLDMLFLNEGGVVTHIKEHAKPESLDLISSNGPVRYVVELNGGAVSRHGIKVGDRVRHPAIDGR